MARDRIQGRTLGDFVVRDKLGEGGFGAVYRAEQPLLQREAVIKVLHQHLRASEVVIQRFLREARLASHLDHPYAAHVYAFGAEPDGLLWIAMEMVRGTPLDALLRAQGALPAERLAQLLDRICEVVHTAHEQGIVHRDIKPANVIVLSRAGRILPKLLDFGIAKMAASELSEPRRATTAPVADTLAHDTTVAPLDATLADASPADGDGMTDSQTIALTRAGSLVGSPSYMAPEQWIDPSATDARADIYAVGVLAYETLTGRRPFEGKTILDVAAAHAEGAIPPVGDGHPAALDAVFATAMAKQPADRYASALDLAIAFRAACGLALDSRESLPQLDESLRDALIASAPQPIAEAVAILVAARNARQARDAMRVLVRVASRLVGLVALASRTRLGPPDGRDPEPVLQALRALRRRPFGDDEWLELARELCRPYARTPAVFPVPELVALFFDVDGGERPALLDESLLAFASASGVSDDQVRELLAQMLPGLARFLRAIAFLSDYPLVVWHGERAELWTGLRRTRRAALAVTGKPLVAEQPALVDADGRPILSLWPLVQVAPPSPGAPDELFLFEGKGRHGARLVALPQELERHDDALWAWFGDTLLDTLDTSGGSSPQSDAPYRGLAPFGPGDAALFFGREREVDAFTNRIRTQPLIAVVGPSGAGKSSFVQAGVLPALPERWRALVMRPGPAPLVALRAKLAELCGTVPDPDDAEALVRRVREHALETETTIVLVVDQLEELFTLCHDEEQRVRFAETIASAARSVEDPVRVIVTLRDDFLIHAEQLAPLRTRLAQGLQLLATPDRDDLLRILVEPARAVGYDFEDRELPSKMIDEVADRPGALALLSFSAAKLWELRDRHFKQLPRSAYEAMGGVGGALAQHAEAMLAALSPDEQRLVREAFRNLVTAEGTRAVLDRRELLQLLGSGPRAETVVERLVGARLLVASEGEGGEERIEIIHEALLTAWPRLVEWRREDAEGARLRDQLRTAARQWEEHKRTRGLLWRDEALTEYQLWRARHPGALTASETAFANASLAEARRGRLVRRGLLAAAFVSLVGVAVVLTLFNREARQQTAEARRQIIKLYTEQGRRALLDGYRQRALVFLSEAWRLGGREPALEFLVKRAGTALDQQVAKLEGHTAWVRDARFSPDGRTVVTISDDHTARLWDAETGAQRQLLKGHTDWVRGVVFAPDGSMIVTTSWDGTARAWDARTGAARWTVDLREGRALAQNPRDEMRFLSLPCAADVSPDGAHYVAACVDRRAAVISREGKVVRWLADHESFVRGASFSPDGTRILTIQVEKPAQLHDAATGQRVAVLAAGGRILNGHFDQSGRVLTLGSDGTATVWSPDGTAALTLRGHQGLVWAGRISRDGSRIVTSGVDRTVRIWDGRDGHAITTVRSHDAPIGGMDIDADATLIFSGDNSGLGILSDGAGNQLGVFEGHHLQVWSARFSSDGARVVTAGGDGTARVWRVDGDELRTQPLFEAPVMGVRFLPGTSTLLAASEDGTVRRQLGTNESTVLARFEKPIWALEVDPRGHHVAVATVDGVVHLLDGATGRTVRELRGHQRRVNAIAFDARGRIATAGEEGIVILWDERTGARVGEIVASKQPVYALAFDPRSQLLASGGEDETLRFWGADRTEVRAISYDAVIGQIAFCDSRVLVASGANIHISSLDGRSKGIIATQGDAVMAVQCAAQRVISAGGGELRISDLASGHVLERVRVKDVDLFSIDVDAGGQIASGGLRGALTFVKLAIDLRNPESIVEQARESLPFEVSEAGSIRAKK